MGPCIHRIPSFTPVSISWHSVLDTEDSLLDVLFFGRGTRKKEKELIALTKDLKQIQ